MRLVLICFTLFFVPLHSVWAQKAKYSDAIMGEQMYMVGAVGNTIHAWSTKQKSKKIFKEVTLLTLHIFSPDMTLIDEKKISLGESSLTRIDFQIENSFYYININYRTGINKRLMFKVDAAGNLIDVTDIPWLLTRMHNTSGSPSVSINSSNIFAGEISAGDADSTIVNTSLPWENFTDKQSYEKLVVQKVSADKRQVTGEKLYTSHFLHFSRLVVTATDSTVYACALAQSKALINKNPYKGSYLFLARLDTNLVGTSDATILLKNEKWPPNLQFMPYAVFSFNKRLLVLSTVLYSYPNVAYNSGGIINASSSVPQAFKNYVPGSIIVTETDENNRILTDTIIKTEEAQWGNRYVLPASNEVHLFCSHRYTDSKAGITLFTIGQNETINEKDLIVNENYIYDLRQALSLAPGVLLVPYTYKRKMGLMKLVYGTAE